jgi:predicted aspartyl protease
VGNTTDAGQRRTVANVLVDTGAEFSVFPAEVLDSLGVVRGKRVRFRQADGSVFERDTGPGTVFLAGTYATDDLVFGEPGDIVLLGARSLEGLNLRVDPISKRLIDAGPVDAAAA